MWEDLILEGLEARQAKDKAQFKLGDLAGRVETHYGQHSLANYAEEIGIGYEQLRRYRWVSQQYENVVRTTNLSWTHHERVAAREDRLEWLIKAQEHHWSVRNMVLAMYESEGLSRKNILIREASDALWSALHDKAGWDSLTLEELLQVRGMALDIWKEAFEIRQRTERDLGRLTLEMDQNKGVATR